MAKSGDPVHLDRFRKEACITAQLEHPNIVPVHDLAAGPDGSPRLLLKRIEGTTWAERMRDDAGVRSMFGARDLLVSADACLCGGNAGTFAVSNAT